jgi:CRP-like cAMP-binding protein
MVPAGTLLIRENDPPVNVFAVKEGRLSVWVEGPVGTPRFIRCCFPGELLGETAVLGSADATCTATVRAEGPAVVWRLQGAALRGLADELPELRRKIDSTGLRHRLDSFFSLSTGAGGLDARLRDRLLSCFSGLREVTAGQPVLAARSVPDAVYLVADGECEGRGPGGARWTIGPGRFIGLRDALHQLPSAAECVTLGPGRLVCFDVARLRALVADAPPEVIAALDTLE